MKFFSNARLVVLLLIVLAFGVGRAAAGVQATYGGTVTTNGFGLTVAYSTNYFYESPGAVVTNFVFVTNLTGQLLVDLNVTNEFSEPVEFIGEAVVVTNEDITTFAVLTNGSSMVFNFQVLPTNGVAEMYFGWHPTKVAQITNTTIVSSGNVGVTNTATLVLTKPVYAANSDVVVTNYIVSQAYVTNGSWYVTNDWITYGVIVSNGGPGAATGLVLSNTLPAGVTAVSGSQVINVGSLAAGRSTNYHFTVRAATNGAFVLSDAVGIPSTLYDPAAGNGATTEELFITNYAGGTLQAAISSGQVVNLQNGLLEQMIKVKNTNSTAVESVRVVVSGLARQLYNASGTNLGQPYVVYPLPLAAGASVSLRLQFNPRTAFSFANSQLHAYGVPATVLHYTPPLGLESFAYAANSPDFYRIIPKADAAGDTLLEFLNPILGSSFTIVYYTNANFTNAMIATPAISSSANRIQWLDYGPPGTVSAPTNSPARFYRVLMNP